MFGSSVRYLAAVTTLMFTVVPILGGCGGQMRMQESAALVSSKIKLGMTRGEAIYLLGRPQRTETVGTTEFLFYTPIWYVPPMLVTSQSPVAIQEGKVVGIGTPYYEETLRGARPSGGR